MKGEKIIIPGVIDKDFGFYSRIRTRKVSIPYKVRNYILKKFFQIKIKVVQMEFL